VGILNNKVQRCACAGLTLVLAWAWNAGAQGAFEPLKPWRNGVKVAPVSPQTSRHTIHSYYRASPESPDGRWALFFSSTTPEGYEGEVRIRNRASGEERVLARNVTTEDAHRAACQQWVSRGRRVVFHDLRRGEWVVVAVDIDTRKERVLASGRQLGWGQPDSDLVTMYGPHWNPGPHRDLEILNVETGEIRTVVTAEAVLKTYPREIAKAFGDRPVSIFTSSLSPDLKRVFFKMATPAGGHFRSEQASIRKLLIVYDLEKSRFLFLRENWGHPGWHPDSRTIINVPTILIESDNGSVRRIPDLPVFPDAHPSVSPDARLFVTDTELPPFGGTKGEWGVVVGDMRGKDYVFLHRFDGSKGAKSWRRNDPHPAFSADGKRVYFNVNATDWTQLYVAESK